MSLNSVKTAIANTSRANRMRWFPVVAGATAAASIWYYSTNNAAAVQAESKKALKGDDQWVDFRLKETRELSKNTRHIVFELPSKDHVLGLETAGCILTKFTREENGKNVIRPYTPVSDPDTQGVVEFVIKRYDQGLMTNHIFNLKPNDTLAFKGPIQKYKWTPNKHNEIALLGGGSGITPLYQLMHEINKNPEDKTKVHLIYGNVTEDDILIKKELEQFAKDKPDQFKVDFFVDNPSKSWSGLTGYVTKEFLQKSLFTKDADNVKVFVCGPPGFYKALSGMKKSPSDQGELTGALADLGFTSDQVFKF